MNRKLRLVGFRIAMLLSAAPAVLAQSAQVPGAPEDFGGATNLTVYSYRDFLPFSSNGTFAGSVNLPAGPTRWATSGSGNLTAPANDLPEGALILGFDVYYYDVSAATNLFFNFCRTFRDTGTGANPDTTCLASHQTSGAPGNAYDLVTIPIPADQTIRYRGNFDGDPAIETADYYLDIQTPDLTGDVRIASVRIRWERQVSPAPLTATFDDVPVSHPFFRFVEALADAEITAGCGGGNFCPDDPITRGEMAVFLSAALGLFWTSF